MITIEHTFSGITLSMPNPMEYTDETCLYICGDLPPHYPVPAIRQSFEWGWRLDTNEGALMHVYQGVYES